MRHPRRHALAASFVVTVAALPGCDDKPKYAPNPPPPTATFAPNPPAPTPTISPNPPAVQPDAGAGPTATGDPIPQPLGDGGRRHIIANPPRPVEPK